MVDLVRMAEERDSDRALIRRQNSVHLPDTDEAIAVAREHELPHLVGVEAEAGYRVEVLKFLLVCSGVERVLGAEIFDLTVGLLEVIEIVLAGLIRHKVFDTTTLSLLDDWRWKKENGYDKLWQ